MKKYILPLCLVLLLFSAAPAMAAYIDLGVAGEYNTFLFSDYSMENSDTQGRLAVDGNVTLNTYSVGDQLGTATTGSALVASGNLNFAYNGTVHGDVTVGGTATVGNGATVLGTTYENADMPFSFSEAETYLRQLASDLSEIDTNGEINNDYNALTFTGNNTSLFQVFNLDAAALLSATGLFIDQIAEGATILINVSGSSSGMSNFSMSDFADYGSSVLFNFYETDLLTLGGGISVEGSILAPYADVEASNGHINGTLIADSLTGHFQQNNVPFTSTSPDPGPTPVPEPGTFVIMGFGLLALALFLRRRGRA